MSDTEKAADKPLLAAANSAPRSTPPSGTQNKLQVSAKEAGNKTTGAVNFIEANAPGLDALAQVSGGLAETDGADEEDDADVEDRPATKRRRADKSKSDKPPKPLVPIPGGQCRCLCGCTKKETPQCRKCPLSKTDVCNVCYCLVLFASRPASARHKSCGKSVCWAKNKHLMYPSG